MEIDFGGPHNAADFSRSTPTSTPLLDFRTVPYSADPDGYCERKVWGNSCPPPLRHIVGRFLTRPEDGGENGPLVAAMCAEPGGPDPLPGAMRLDLILSRERVFNLI